MKPRNDRRCVSRRQVLCQPERLVVLTGCCSDWLLGSVFILRCEELRLVLRRFGFRFFD
jgi:hypothetical protein